MELTLIMAAFAIPAIVAALIHLRDERRLEWLRQRMGAESTPDRGRIFTFTPKPALAQADGAALGRSPRPRAR